MAQRVRLHPLHRGSVGWARSFSDTKRVHVPTQTSLSEEGEKDSLAWVGLVGVDWRFAESWSVELAYRYLDLGEVDAGSFPAGDGLAGEDYTTQDVFLSVSYRF